MDERLINDFVSVQIEARVRELRAECHELKTRVDELETAFENKSEEVLRLRRSVKQEEKLKQSALSKLAQIDFAGSNASLTSNPDHWRTLAASMEQIDGDDDASDGEAKSSRLVDQDLQRRLLELELQLVSREREKITKHKAIIDHYEKLLQEKRAQIKTKDQEIQRMRSELEEKQSKIYQLRIENGFTLRTTKSPSSILSFPFTSSPK